LIFGTRPEAIKMCPLIKELKKEKSIDLRVLSTGQHKTMLDDVLKIENVKVDYDLSLMKKGQTLSYLTTEILNGVVRISEELLPDFILVHGDTVTAFAASLAAFYRKIPIGHVEAGLRTFDKYNPYPEEVYRCAISKMASYHFAPTEMNMENLIREGIKKESIFVTGNTVIDALVKNLAKKSRSGLVPEGDFVIFTAHRRESFGEDMKNVFLAVKELSERENVRVIYPIHKNERILSLANEIFEGNGKVKIIPPLLVDEFHVLLSKCKFIITDSGGIQEEAAYLGKPLLITRKCTERKELLSNEGVKLVGSDVDAILKEAHLLLNNSEYYEKNSVPSLAFGDGTASRKIRNCLCGVLREM